MAGDLSGLHPEIIANQGVQAKRRIVLRCHGERVPGARAVVKYALKGINAVYALEGIKIDSGL